MYIEVITPRFSDTDALGHVNNTMIPIWFEGARDPVFRIFSPELNLKEWPLILAKIDVVFHAQIFYGQSAEIHTYISRIGNASFDVYQELWQNDEKCASGTAVMVNFCYQSQTSAKITKKIKTELQQHVIKNSEKNA